ncbi:MAG: 30S ribosomal protein S19 [Nanoarchaeota archaeon]|nr:30S ribosomal protein S19 [Nanoarchaeota archaeon]
MKTKDFTYKGYSLEELQNMSVDQVSKLMKTNARRFLKRGLKTKHKDLLKKIRTKEKPVKTHLREMVVLPVMVGKTIRVHDGKEFVPLEIKPKMIGHRIGEFVDTRKRIRHGAPGVGATRSSMFVPIK